MWTNTINFLNVFKFLVLILMLYKIYLKNYSLIYLIITVLWWSVEEHTDTDINCVKN